LSFQPSDIHVMSMTTMSVRRMLTAAATLAVAALMCSPAVAALTPDDLTRLSTQLARHPGTDVIGPRIVGGTQAANGEFPFMVSLQTPGGFHFCGGSILDATHVLTAAHCVEGNTSPSDVRAVVGRHDVTRNGQVKQVASIHVHPQYTGANDIAILKLASAINMVNPSSGYTPAPVARNAAASNEASGTQVTVMGWGATSEGGGSPTYLRKVSVPMISVSKCRSQYGSAVTDDFICAGLDEGGRDSCQGDSGGPMVVMVNGQPVQTGIVSWGAGCARPNQAGVYSSVRYFQSWINSIVGNGDSDNDDGNDDTPPDADHNAGVHECGDAKCLVRVQIRQDDYPEETSWKVQDASGTVVMQGGAESKRKRLPPGDYMLTVFDSYGDGMCCDYGYGRWRLKFGKTTIAQGGTFESQETAWFRIVSSTRSRGWEPEQELDDDDSTKVHEGGEDEEDEDEDGAGRIGGRWLRGKPVKPMKSL
jgi:trypsin